MIYLKFYVGDNVRVIKGMCEGIPLALVDGQFTGKDPISFDKYYNLNKREKKQKYIRFKIEENDYDKVVEILKREGVKIY